MSCPGRMGDSAGLIVTQQLMGAETSCLEIVIIHAINHMIEANTPHKNQSMMINPNRQANFHQMI